MEKQVRDGFIEMKHACDALHINLRELIARVAIFPPVEAVEELEDATPPYVVVPNCRRLRRADDEKRGTAGEIILDDNTRANGAIKQVLGGRKSFRNYEACHIWPGTCYDVNYHTALPNLVLLPRGIASLSDHVKEIVQDLQYRAYELYQWHPANTNRPTKPDGYPGCWSPIREESPHDLKEILQEEKKDRDVLPIDYYPSDINLFKQLFMQSKKALITIHYDNGESKEIERKLKRFSEKSDLKRNIRSMRDFRRDQWLKNGIDYIAVTIPGYQEV